ncbi:MAG: P-II family nitrogen regulator [Nitrospirota bacterium]
MKEIKAFIQPFMLSKVTAALQQISGFPGMSVTKIQGFGREKAKGAPHRIVEDLIDYVPKVKIEIIVNDGMVEEVAKIIQQNAHTGNKGDGKIFIYDVRDAIRIRTGERGETAV